MKAMAAGAAVVARQLYDDGKLGGIIGMGGSGGSSVITAAMRELPTGVPKVCVTTVAGGDVHAFVGTKDVTLIPSVVVDVAGLIGLSRTIYTRAAGGSSEWCELLPRRLWRSANHRGQYVWQYDSMCRRVSRIARGGRLRSTDFHAPALADARWSRSSTKDLSTLASISLPPSGPISFAAAYSALAKIACGGRPSRDSPSDRARLHRYG